MMQKENEPVPYIYSWAVRQYNSQLTNNLGPGLMCLVIPLLQWNDAFDIASMHNKIRQYLNPSINTGPQAGTSIPVLNKFAVGDYRAEFTIKNTNNLETVMDIYTCVAREDVDANITPISNWGSQGTAGVQYYDCLYPLIQGLTEQNGGNGGGNVATLTNWPVGVSAYDINKFCTYFKILKCKRNVVIAGGGFKSFAVRDKKWRMYNGTKVVGCNGQQSGVGSASSVVFGGRTKFVFAIAHTFGVTQTTTHTSGANFGPVDLVTTASERFYFTGSSNAIKYYNYYSDANTNIVASNLSTIDAMTEIQTGYIVA